MKEVINSTTYVWYKIVDDVNKKVLGDHPSRACYYGISRGNDISKSTTDLILYHHKDSTPYEANEWAQWAKEVTAMGFPMEYIGMGNKDYDISKDHYVIKVPIKNGEEVFYANKLKLVSALMIARYLMEIGLNTLPEVYFELKKQLPDADPFYLMQMAHHTAIKGNTNHSLRGKHIMKFMGRKEFEKMVADCKVGIYNSEGVNIEGSWNKPMLEGTIPKDVKELYKKLLDEKTKVFVVGGSKDYANWLPDIQLVDKIEDADLALFTGGEDVDPSIYGEKTGSYTQSNISRDKKEKLLFQKAEELKILKLGICRGSQFLCTMSGGKLVQHQQNPGGQHLMETTLGKINITSTHHQAQFPFNLKPFEYKIIGWTKDASKYHLDGSDEEMYPKKECEIVYYRNTRSLGIQGHPEFTGYQKDPENKQSMEVLKQIFKDFVNNKL